MPFIDDEVVVSEEVMRLNLLAAGRPKAGGCSCGANLPAQICAGRQYITTLAVVTWTGLNSEEFSRLWATYRPPGRCFCTAEIASQESGAHTAASHELVMETFAQVHLVCVILFVIPTYATSMPGQPAASLQPQYALGCECTAGISTPTSHLQPPLKIV